MREIISLHIGSCGTNVGLATWEQFLREEGQRKESCNKEEVDDCEMNSFFALSKNGKKLFPRSVFVDSDISSSNVARLDPCMDGLKPSNFVAPSNFPESEKDWHKLAEDCLDSLRLRIERSDMPEGFCFYVGGSSYATARILPIVANELKSTMKSTQIFNTCILPSFNEDLDIQEAKLTATNWAKMMECSDLAFFYQNEAIAKTYRQTGCCLNPSMHDLNLRLAQATSMWSLSLRGFKNTPYSSMGEIQSSLVPYPRIFSVTPSLSLPQPHGFTEVLDPLKIVSEFPYNRMFDYGVNLKENSHMAFVQLFRGSNSKYSPYLNQMKTSLEAKVKLVDWSPCVFKFYANQIAVTSANTAKFASPACQGLTIEHQCGMHKSIRKLLAMIQRSKTGSDKINEEFNEDFEDSLESLRQLVADLEEITVEAEEIEENDELFI